MQKWDEHWNAMQGDLILIIPALLLNLCVTTDNSFPLFSFQICRPSAGGGGEGEAWCFKGQSFCALPVPHPSLFTVPARPFYRTCLLLFLKLHLEVLSVTIYPVKWESCWVACLHLLVSSWAPLPQVWSISTSHWEFLQVRALCTIYLTLTPFRGCQAHQQSSNS